MRETTRRPHSKAPQAKLDITADQAFAAEEVLREIPGRNMAQTHTHLPLLGAEIGP